MSDQLYIKYRSFDSKADPTYKETTADWLIGWRSYLKHTEIEFPDIYGNISFSATMADGCKCARFKMIDYTKHPKRWKTILIPVTREQCYFIFTEACKMADCQDIGWSYAEGVFYADQKAIKTDDILYGPNALKYDLLAVSFSFISKRTIWRPDKTKVFCTESVFILLQIAFPDILTFSYNEDPDIYWAKLKPDQLTPSLGDMIVRDFARKVA